MPWPIAPWNILKLLSGRERRPAPSSPAASQAPPPAQSSSPRTQSETPTAPVAIYRAPVLPIRRSTSVDYFTPRQRNSPGRSGLPMNQSYANRPFASQRVLQKQKSPGLITPRRAASARELPPTSPYENLPDLYSTRTLAQKKPPPSAFPTVDTPATTNEERKPERAPTVVPKQTVAAAKEAAPAPPESRFTEQPRVAEEVESLYAPVVGRTARRSFAAYEQPKLANEKKPDKADNGKKTDKEDNAKKGGKIPTKEDTSDTSDETTDDDAKDERTVEEKDEAARETREDATTEEKGPADKHIKPITLVTGDILDRFHIQKKLREGSFGAIYKVSDGSSKYMMKVESVHRSAQMLEMELYILGELSKHRSRHFYEIVSKGKWGPFKFAAMTSVGKTLEDLREASPVKHLSPGTALGVAIQALEAIEDLHDVGFLHRDVKPTNFAIGRRDEVRKLYLIDFCLCRKFVTSDNTIRRPRKEVGFRGTPRYASIASHRNRELARKDDVESWLYMSVELFKGDLPWNYVSRNEIIDLKEKCRVQPGLLQLLIATPPEFRSVLKIVDELKYYDVPPYEKIYNLLRKAIGTVRCEEFPYDWERPARVNL